MLDIRLVLCCFLLSACTKTYYSPEAVDTQNKNGFAQVSFSNLSAESPEILIVDKCKTAAINNGYIEKKLPTDKASKTLLIPAGRQISFIYNYMWIGNEKKQLVSSGGTFHSKIDTVKSREASSCSESVSFTPEKNQNYEIYFGKNIEKCVIKASRVVFEPATNKKRLVKIETTGAQSCK